jgi:hypothetical protein
LEDDFVGDDIDGEAHVFIAIKGRVEIKVFLIKAHELRFGGRENAVEQDFCSSGCWETPTPNCRNPHYLSKTWDQYTAVFRNLHKQQSAQRVTSSHREQIWTLPLENLHKLVKKPRQSVRKATSAENLEAGFAPYAAVDKYDKLEDEL